MILPRLKGNPTGKERPSSNGGNCKDEVGFKPRLGRNKAKNSQKDKKRSRGKTRHINNCIKAGGEDHSHGCRRTPSRKNPGFSSTYFPNFPKIWEVLAKFATSSQTFWNPLRILQRAQKHLGDLREVRKNLKNVLARSPNFGRSSKTFGRPARTSQRP